jgi:hypothetical protein
VQAENGVANRLEHPLHLVLATFVDRQLQARGSDALDRRRRRLPVLELDALGELP